MIGLKVGQYQILENLGEGGMGVVYKARDTRLIEGTTGGHQLPEMSLRGMSSFGAWENGNYEALPAAVSEEEFLIRLSSLTYLRPSDKIPMNMIRNEMEFKGTVQKIIDLLGLSDEIVFAYLHGSFIRREAFRDVDVAVFLRPGAPLSSDDVEYEISLSLRLEKACGLPADVKILNRAPLGFRYHASGGILLLSRDESAREDFLNRTWGEYFDFARLARVYQEELTRA